MNWSAVRRYNAIRSARKAKREAYTAQRNRRVEQAGGPVTLAELRGATCRLDRPVGVTNDRVVWSFRGADWVLTTATDWETWLAYPYCPWRCNGMDLREAVPVTPAAQKTLKSWFAQP